MAYKDIPVALDENARSRERLALARSLPSASRHILSVFMPASARAAGPF
jgi:hypothetical protein